MKQYDFQAGEVILVDKPYGWTSFDVVNKIRWHLRKKYNLKKFKVGHAGTLDPLATGLLVLCTGKATKEIDSFSKDDKTYTGTFLLGKTTPCYDLEQSFNKENHPIAHITDKMLNEAVQTFIGKQEQIPPIYSAKQIDGKRAYEHARTGELVDLKPNVIDIKSFTIDSTRFPEIDFEIQCSKGTYIRSIANDLGEKLNTGATLIDLRRTNSGSFDIINAKSINNWIEIIK